MHILTFFLVFREAEFAREYENRAALSVQSVWRGYRVRSNNRFVIFEILFYQSSIDISRFLHRCATIIQTWWRIYKARVLFRQKLKSHVVQLRLKYYDDNAVKVRKNSSPLKITVLFSFYGIFRFKKSGEDIMYGSMFWIITVDNDISMELNKRTNRFGLNSILKVKSK